MKWLRIILPMFLIMGLLLCISSVAYADDPPDEDPGLDVDITVVGDNPDVNVDVLGENAEVTVNASGTDIWVNGQNLNEPTAVYNIYQGGGVVGVNGGWVKKRISEALAPFESWAASQTANLDLTMEGLAKVILLAQSNESMLETLGALSDEHGNRLTDLESETAYLGERVDALDAKITAEVNSYKRTLAIVIGAFSLVLIGLVTGLVLLWKRV